MTAVVILANLSAMCPRNLQNASYDRFTTYSPLLPWGNTVTYVFKPLVNMYLLYACVANGSSILVAGLACERPGKDSPSSF
jgi:hypothetical protein